MALETLKGITNIGGFDVAELEEFATERPKEYIVVNHKNNGINFIIQNGPIKEHGVNGCQVDTLIEAALIIIKGLNGKLPDINNAQTIDHLNSALYWLKQRKINREMRGVEGTNQI